MSATMTDATLCAYRRWAPTYPPVAHNPLMRAEQRAMLEHWPAIAGRRSLDLACGSGRYTRILGRHRARTVTAVDFCLPMLEQVSGRRRVCADMMRLPFADASFDFVVCGLAVGHASKLQSWVAEIARVLSPGGVLLYSDFHPEAARAGHTRSFKDRNDETCTVPHRCFELSCHREAIELAGLTLQVLRELRVGVELREPFEHSAAFYRRWHGLPIALVVRALRPGRRPA
jgi:malonyl-CoA O-methyltransferase